MQGLAAGRIVHYVDLNYRHLAAIVTGVQDQEAGTVSLTVFSDVPNLNGITFEQNVPYHEQVLVQETTVPQTWHWPEKA